MENTLDIALPQEATALEQVESYIKNPPAVMYCPQCTNEYYEPIEREFLAEFGICLGCDKSMCDVVTHSIEI